MKNFLLLIVLLGNILFQDRLPYDVTKVSDEKELNFYQTDKRGIKYMEVVYYVESDLNRITAYQKDNKVKWKVNCKKKFTSGVVGERKIRHIKIYKEKLQVTYAKHDFFDIDLKTGKLNYFGSD